MKLFTTGKEPFLEFLRNLTPQVLILTVAFLSLNGLKPSFCEPSNLFRIFLAFCVWCVVFAAFAANVALFTEKYLKPEGEKAEEYKQLQQAKVGLWVFLKSLICYTYKDNRGLFIEFVIVIILILVAISVITRSAHMAALNYMQLLLG